MASTHTFTSTSLADLTLPRYQLPKHTMTITLACGCTALFARPIPRIDDTVFCRRCDTWSVRARG